MNGVINLPKKQKPDRYVLLSNIHVRSDDPKVRRCKDFLVCDWEA